MDGQAGAQAMSEGRLDEVELAHARGGAYLLLADLLTVGPRPELLEAAQASPILAEAVAGDPDELAADHHHVFGFCVPPLEGLFLDPDGRAGGRSAEEVGATYAAIGVRPDPTREEPEHLATELRALAYLCGAEAEARRAGEWGAAQTLGEHQRRLLDAHVRRWLPAFAVAARRVGRPFPSALVAQIEDVVRHHRHGLAAADDAEADWALPEPLDIDDPEVGLREIARGMTTPARAGVFFGRHEIAELGRAFRLPRGFGGRARMMHQLLTAAVRFDALADLTGAMIALAEDTDAALAAWGPVASPWRERAAHTRGLLARLHEAAGVEGLGP